LDEGFAGWVGAEIALAGVFELVAVDIGEAGEVVEELVLRG